MARRTSDVVDIIEILVHWHAGRNNSEIAQSLNVDRKTARKYIAVAEAPGMAPGGPPLSEAEWDARVRAWFPELADTRLRQVTWPSPCSRTISASGSTSGTRTRSRTLACSEGVWDVALCLPVVLEEIHELATLAKWLLRARDREISPGE